MMLHKFRLSMLVEGVFKNQIWVKGIASEDSEFSVGP